MDLNAVLIAAVECSHYSIVDFALSDGAGESAEVYEAPCREATSLWWIDSAMTRKINWHAG